MPYNEPTALLGKWIAQRGHTLVYGGATGGLMDAVANAAYAEGGKIVGVIPSLIIEIGRLSNVCTELFEVKDMSERKDKMQQISDIFVVLPGGIGTMDEMFDTISKVALKYFDKHTYIVNIDGYWDSTIEQLEDMEDGRLGSYKNFLTVVGSVEELISAIER